jgi:hypothetical protein
MAWWNPSGWFSKKAPEASPSTEIPVERWVQAGLHAVENAVGVEPIPDAPIPPSNSPYVWVKVNPAAMHQGLDHYSDAPNNPFTHALLVLGIGPEEARSELVGKVLDWALLTATDLAELEARSALVIGYETLKRMFR